MKRWAHRRNERQPIRQHLYVFTAELYNRAYNCNVTSFIHVDYCTFHLFSSNNYMIWCDTNIMMLTIFKYTCTTYVATKCTCARYDGKLPMTGSRRHGPGAWLYVRWKIRRTSLQQWMNIRKRHTWCVHIETIIVTACKQASQAL